MQKKTLLAVLSGLSTKILKGLNATLTIEQQTNAIFDRCAASNFAANAPDDVAEPGTQELELAPGALELVGMNVASYQYGSALRGRGGWARNHDLLGMKPSFCRFRSVSTPNAAKIIRHGIIGTE